MANIITFIKKYYVFLLFILVIALSVFLFRTLSTLKQERADRKFEQKIEAQNLSALKDSITTEYDKKLKAYVSTSDNFVVNKLSDLEKYNKSLTDELKKMKGDILSVIESKIQADLGGITTKNDSIVVLDEKTNHYGLKFNSPYSDAGFQQKLIGMSKFYVIPNETTKKWTITPDATIFSTNLTSIAITYGFEDLKDKYKVFAYTKSDKIKITDITGGYFIDKQIVKPIKNKKWGIGPQIGYGMSTNSNLTNPSFGWNIGIGVHYDILKW